MKSNKSGSDESYQLGYNEGHQAGYVLGYDVGYEEAQQSQLGLIEAGVDEIASAVEKLDVEFILQPPTKDFVSYHMGVSYGGLPVVPSLNQAFGAYYSPDTGTLWNDITADINIWSMGDGHLRLFVNLPESDDYWMYQFVLEADVDGTLLFGTIHVDNDNIKHWPN